MRTEGVHPWERVTVAGVEAGTRGLSPTEQAALCGVFRRSWVQFLRLDDDETHLLLDGATWRPEEVAVETGPSVWVGWPTFISAFDAGEPLYVSQMGGPGPEQLRPDETDRKAARALGVSADEVRHAALGLWGRSLSAERDRLLDESAGPDDTARTLQARRGHITRSLTAALRSSVEISSGKGEST